MRPKVGDVLKIISITPGYYGDDLECIDVEIEGKPVHIMGGSMDDPYVDNGIVFEEVST